MVFYISITVILLFVLWGAFMPENMGAVTAEALAFTVNKFGWFYLLAAFSLLLFALYLAMSKYGKIKLGKDDDEPEYSLPTWFAMLFSAGMGIGLVFWGVSEPLSHYLTPPSGTGGTQEAAQLAMRYSFFHWGFQPWAIYAIIALSLAYFQFRKGQRGLISSTFYPLLGERVNGPFGKIIDVLAVIATVFGVATSLGLGVLQINGGLTHLTGMNNTITTQIIIIIVVTVLYLVSATTGLDRGIKILSNTNLVLAAGLLLCVLFLGPTTFIFDTYTSTLGSYLQNLVHMSLRLTPFTDNNWIASWTLFYWAWWISWAPFVGLFIARISKGRTIREFVLAVLFVPTLFSCLWFTVFGGTGLYQVRFEGSNLAQVAQEDVTMPLFLMLETLPLGTILAVIATLLIIVFFVTSADSATFVLGMLSSKGDLHPDAKIKIIWGVLQSAIAIVLLMSGGLNGLQTAAIVTALPFAIILVAMCFSIVKALQQEEKARRKEEKALRRKLETLLEDD
ncbi:glycine betaine uptake BCCT transporter [Aneurinibacillus aneurinilyticus]|uniref:BCCT family transporter n=2 Tax=Aneurinibacillus aneurinilyticus TaxID=1391 RepID=A0A848CWW6_ANEAE|nr:BCCT family transporter [Aneurinibacillus aneurinilyticus]MED0671199.1 BCCT family transporter [Aneurinibacillus aneurinilyticus]MED0704996.1 BCCT family transporter [Aneurinibacillus aneurinilyticus]MED0721797.1 BCCT family transporter [Aneurinibacillus aneurinilyticus]MED0732745.1 BCCT family transporter [Aneurinibacillus aneurinilyticus]MED0742073.1 BCCT family transporter [Aneurinibacillus aneurinilyticus]